MQNLKDGETIEVKGSGARPYVLRNSGGVYSCSCPAWRNQSAPIESRTCKHLRALRGDDAETQRIGRTGDAAAQAGTHPARPAQAAPAGEQDPALITASVNGPPLLLAHPWDQRTDLSGWWISEKLDGVRAYWDGSRLLSRQGNAFRAPDWFIEQLPPTPLDGELWLARRMFQRTVSIVRRQDASDHWREIAFVVFDAPGLDAPFEARQAHLAEFLGSGAGPHVRVLPQQVCAGPEHLRAELERVLALGGEGLMLRMPGSRYEVGRSQTLFKVKNFHDAEALVVAHQPGAGKHRGRLGALVVEMPDGKRFSVGTGFSDAERVNPPPPGTTITYRYQELTDRGMPRFPVFVRVRSDLAQPVAMPEPGASDLDPLAPGPDCARVAAAIGQRLGATDLREALLADPVWSAWVPVERWLRELSPESFEALHSLIDPSQWQSLIRIGAGSPDPAVRALIAGSPSCPTDTLQALLGDRHPKVFVRALGNPSLSSHPVLPRGESRREALAGNPDAPPGLLVMLAKSPLASIRETLAENPNCPVDAMRLLASDKNPSVRLLIAEHPDCPPDLLRELASGADQQIAWALVTRSDCPPDLLRQFASHADPGVQRMVVGHPHCPVDLLRDFSQRGDNETRTLVAGHPDCPVDLLRQLASDPAWKVRATVAASPVCPLSLLERCGEDGDSAVRLAVAEHPLCPPGLMRRLVTYSEWELRSAVARHPGCPEDLLRQLASDQHPYVRETLARNPNCPVDLLTAFARDSSDEVCMAVAGNPACPGELLQSMLEEEPRYDINLDLVDISGEVLKNPACPPELLRKFAAKDSRWFARSIIENPGCPPDLLQSFSGSEDQEVRRSIASNPHCPPELLRQLASDHDKWIRHHVAENSGCPTELLRQLASERDEQVRARAAQNPNWRPDPELEQSRILQRIRQALDAAGERSASASPHTRGLTRDDILRALRLLGCPDAHAGKAALANASRSRDPLIRLAVALHPRAGAAQLRLLGQDADPDVAAAARLPR